jgi:hypothetical protein
MNTRAIGLVVLWTMLGAGQVLAQTSSSNISPAAPPLTDAQKEAIRSIQSTTEAKGVPVAIQLAAVVAKLYENNLSDTPNDELRAKLDAQMKELVWQALQLKGEAMWAAFRVLSPEQKAIVRVDVAKPPRPGELPDLLDVIARRFGPLAK